MALSSVMAMKAAFAYIQFEQRCIIRTVPSVISLPSPRIITRNTSNKLIPHSTRSFLIPVLPSCSRLTSISAVESEYHQPPEQDTGRSEGFHRWDSLTAKFSAAANLPFLLLQLPQIILNASNLLAGNKAALFALPWLGMLTGLLGNLSLLSYFVNKQEREAMVVQTLGVVSTYMVIVQLALAEAMPTTYFIATSAVIVLGIILNFLNFFGFLNHQIWCFWEDFITVGGLSVLSQVMWSTFTPFVPRSVLPGAVSFFIAISAVITARIGILPQRGIKFVSALSGWSATLLFMWMPVAQMWTNFLNPGNIKGLSAISVLLAMIGNGLMIPRAIFVRDLMWFIGCIWAAVFYGWGNLLCLHLSSCITRELLLAATASLGLWLGGSLWMDSRAHGYDSLMMAVKELVTGR